MKRGGFVHAWSNQRGLSEIVATLLIILLTLVAVAIVWVVVSNIVQRGAEQIELGQFTLDLEIKAVQVQDGGVTIVVVKRNPGQGEFIGMNFVFSDGQNSETIRQDVSLQQGDQRSFTLALTKISTANLKTVSVYPIYRLSSGKESIGSVADIFDVPSGKSMGAFQPLGGNFALLGFSGAGMKEYSISSQSGDIVKFSKATVDPLDVLPGDNQTFTVIVYSPNGIIDVTSITELDNSILNLDFMKISDDGAGTSTWSVSWIVNDTHTIEYTTEITATDSEGNSGSVTLTWTDSCQSQITPHGADRTLSTSCTTGVNGVDGIDAGSLTIATGVTLTIDSGSRFIFNQGKSITVTASGAKIVSTSTGSFGNGYLYYFDSDGDGNSDNATLLSSTTGVDTTARGSVNILGQEGIAAGLHFSSNGSYMYLTGQNFNRVFQYSMSQVWNVSNASYMNKNFSVSQASSVSDLFFNGSGTKMYVLSAAGRVYQYTLSPAWEASTASYDNKNFTLSTQDSVPAGLAFKTDGTKMYMSGQTTDRVYQYSLSTPWDVSTASYDNKNFSTTTQDGNSQAIFFKDDGTKMFMAGSDKKLVYQYTLSSTWDVSTASYDNKNFSTSPNQATGLFFKPDGLRMYVVEPTGDRAYQYSLASAWSIEGRVRAKDASGTSDCNATDVTAYTNGYGRDDDGDNYGVNTFGCHNGLAPYTATTGQDCYDSNANAKPGQTTYFPTHRGDNSYDYNCDSGVETKQFTAIGDTGATIYYDASFNCVSLFDSGNGPCNCQNDDEGWIGSVPACGVSGNYYTPRHPPIDGDCSNSIAPKTQSCR
ncbi:MAG: hypothetical protein Q8P79_03520 [Nanoarchaeota archaeon]|nr:hypothetical protein [Nanoarchaeota archaeon]